MIGSSFGADTARPWLAGLDPRAKIAWVFGVSVVAVTVDETWPLAALALAAAAAGTGLRLHSRGWLTIVGLLGVLAWGVILTQGFFYPAPNRTALWTIVAPRQLGDYAFPGIALSLEGMHYGAIQSLRLLATALAGFTLSLSTGPERLLAALSWLRVPAALGFMTTAALRFLPVLVEETITVRQARRMRGYRFRLIGPPGDRLAPLRNEMGILLPVIASSLRRAETLAESVTARGFEAGAPRTYYPPLRMRGWERIVVAAIFLTCAAIVAAKFA